MSAGSHNHHGRVIPICRTCRSEADSVVTYNDGTAHPMCFSCGTAALEADGQPCREYPLEAYYPPENQQCGEVNPDDDPVFEIFNPDAHEEEWMVADNEQRAGSSHDLTEWS